MTKNKSNRKVKVNKNDAQQVMHFENFTIRDNALYEIIKDKDTGETYEERLGEAVRIKEIRRTHEDQEVKLLLEYYYRGHRHELLVSRGDLQVNELTKLLSKGVDVPSHKVRKVGLFLSIQEQYAPYVNIHKELGWDQQVKDYYKGYKAIGSKEMESIYDGQFDVQPKGTFEGWEQTIKTHVLPYPNLIFMLVYGFSAPVVSKLAQVIDGEALVLHLFGESSTGKTTAT